MDKESPGILRILAMVVFAITCFGLLFFLWLSFGGSVPLKPKRYEVKVHFPEATTLAQQADVRMAGVTVGKVTQKQLDKGGDSTTVTLQIERQYAPIAKDTRAILRQKTLLGETYVELTPGNKRPPPNGAGTMKDGSTLARTQVEPTVELDEILKLFSPDTKKAFRQWVATSAQQIRGNGGQDLNYALGNLGNFAQNGASVLSVLNNQSRALHDVVKNTGVVFAALNRRYGDLQNLIVNSQKTFSATAAEKEALAQVFQIFPTFLDESRATATRLERFSRNTRPLAIALKPAANKLGPTVRDLGRTAPYLTTLFRRLRPVIDASPRDLPQGARFISGAKPLFHALHTFLPEFNPIVSYANYNAVNLSGFLGDGASAINYRLPTLADNVPRYMIAFAGTTDNNSIGLHQTRPQSDRGNAYVSGVNYIRSEALGVGAEAFDCKPDHPDGNGTTDFVGRRNPSEATSTSNGEDLPPCFVEPPFTQWQGTKYPRLHRGQAPLQQRPGVPEALRGLPLHLGP